MALLEGVKHGKFPLYTVSGFFLEMFLEIYIPWLQDGILRNRDQRKLRSEKADQDKAPAVDGSADFLSYHSNFMHYTNNQQHQLHPLLHHNLLQ